MRLNEESNRKLTRLTMVYWCDSGKLARSGQRVSGMIAYTEALATSNVYVNVVGKSVMTLKEFVKSHDLTEIHGFKPFPAGKAPLKLQRDDETRLLSSILFYFVGS